MDYQLSHAYEEAIDLRGALETLYRDVTGNWPLPTQTPRDMCDAIRAAFSRERETARENEQAALL